MTGAQHALPSGRYTGWRPSPPDHRDLLYGLEEPLRQPHQLAAKGGREPTTLPSIWDQLTIGSCTAHGSLRAYLAEAIHQGLSLPMLSRLLQYWNARALEGTTDQDSGATVRDAVKALATLGACPENDWPYDVSKFAVSPPASVVAEARQHMAVRYKSVSLGPGAPLRSALSDGYVVVFGFSVPDYFEGGSWDPASGAPLPLPGPSTGFIGGHCVALTYYDFSAYFTSGPYVTVKGRPFFTCDNSWGASWGMHGRFNLDADWFGRGLATDMWILQAVT